MIMTIDVITGFIKKYNLIKLKKKFIYFNRIMFFFDPNN